ncbi:MAG: RecX family transcriptional regulator [Bacteroidetes bacterium]|jgi:regulatory protein|nr:RecX family transcriptional regulator [Bacteroidota bacterium]
MQPITPEKARSKALKFCAYQERSQQEMRDKIYSWGLHQREVESIISYLIEEGFLKEERFAIAYAGGKFRVKKWGKIKIKLALKNKKISEPLIKKALGEISDSDYRKMLQKVISAKEKLVTEKDPYKRKYKIASYAISRGFEPQLVWEVMGSED